MTVRKFYFTISFLLIHVFSFAQARAIDSLLIITSKAKHDSIKLNAYIKICELCELKDNLKYGHIVDSIADRLIKQSKSPLEKEEFIRKKLHAYFIIGIYYDEQEKLDSLEKYRVRSVEIAKTTTNEDLINKQIDNLAEMYMRENRYTNAMNIYTDKLKIAESIGNSKQIIFALRGISTTYSRTHNNKKALEYQLKILKLVQENAKDSVEVAWEYTNVGQKYYNLYEHEQANAYYLKAFQLLENKINTRQKLKILFHIASSYNELKNTQDAKKYFLMALEMVNSIGDSIISGVVHSEIGQTYFYEKNYGKALEYKLKGIALINGRSDGDAYLPYFTTAEVYLATKQFGLAEKYALLSKKIAENRKDFHNQKAAAKILSNIYREKGDKIKSNEYLVKFYQLKDSLDKVGNAEELLYNELNYESEKNEMRLLAEQKIKDETAEYQKKRQEIIIIAISLGLLLVIVFAGFMLNRYKITQKQKTIIEQKEKETQQQKHLVEEKQQEILDSITYAKRLQEAILPPQEFINKYLSNNFILYKPKDIVAGDFYWAEKAGDLFFIAAADSTGHGVPGAMVSVVCSNALNRTVKEFKLTQTGKILDKTRELVIETFEKSANEVKDGMDISLLCIDLKNKNVFWSGANNPLWYIQDTELKEIKADKQPIGKTDNPKLFTTHQIEYKENTTFYLFTDGLADQFGGPNGKKFKYKQFSDLLVKSNNLTQSQQAEFIEKHFMDWKGDLEQVDDVCVIGIKI